MIYEIRNYHYEPTRMIEYRAWATDKALPYIREHFDLLGFWVSTDEPSEVNGRPLDELGSATVTWILRWPDLATRHERFPKLFGTDEWKAIMADNPGLENYHRMEAKFTEAL